MTASRTTYSATSTQVRRLQTRTMPESRRQPNGSSAARGSPGTDEEADHRPAGEDRREGADEEGPAREDAREERVLGPAGAHRHERGDPGGDEGTEHVLERGPLHHPHRREDQGHGDRGDGRSAHVVVAHRPGEHEHDRRQGGLDRAAPAAEGDAQPVPDQRLDALPARGVGGQVGRVAGHCFGRIS